jgi:hypothetical protein
MHVTQFETDEDGQWASTPAGDCQQSFLKKTMTPVIGTVSFDAQVRQCR